METDCPMGGVIGWSNGPSDILMLLKFLHSLFFDLDLIGSSILSSSKRFSEFHSLSWTELERVCKNSKANSTLVKLLTHEPLFIERSRTKNYKTWTKSSVFHLLVTLESRKILKLGNLSLWLVDHEFWASPFIFHMRLNRYKIIPSKQSLVTYGCH